MDEGWLFLEQPLALVVMRSFHGGKVVSLRPVRLKGLALGLPSGTLDIDQFFTVLLSVSGSG